MPGSAAVGTSLGSVTGVTVTLQGTGKLKLDSQGSILRLGANQTLIIDGAGLTLEGLSTANGDSQDNNTSLINANGANTAIELKAGIIAGNYSTGSGGGINIQGTGSLFTMTGGEITGTRGSIGGGLNLGNGIISGTAKIHNNEAIQGGAFQISGGTVTISGSAELTNNTGNDGGAVSVGTGTLIMEGGTISGNTATRYGGGVCVGQGVALGGTFTINGGSVTGNTATTANRGGGVYVLNSGAIFNGTATANVTGNFSPAGTANDVEYEP